MTVSSDTLALLMKAGLSGEALLDVVRSIESDNPSAPEKPVGGSALRMRRLRARQAEDANSVTLTVTSDVTCDATSDVTSDAAPSSDKRNPQTPKKINSIPGECDAHAREADPISFPIAARIDGADLAIRLILAGTADIARRRWRGMPPPPGVSVEQWRGFLEMRKSIRKTLTDRAYVLLCNRLAEHSDPEWPPGRIVDHMTENGWRSFQPEWLPKDGRHGKRTHDDRQSRFGADPHPGGRHCAAADDIFGGMAG